MPPQDVQTQLDKLRKDLDALTEEVYKNNFSSRQDFNKASTFTTRLKVPHYASIPATGEVGEIIEVDGKLYVCSTPNTYVVAGTQS